LAGKTNIRQLTGIISAFTLFVTSDGGPFHMGVALRAPTLGVFTFENRTHFHAHPWVRCCIATSTNDVPALRAAAEKLMEWGKAYPKGARHAAPSV
jgi:ADP-heptose:LPS heptosyltransferase